uniref:Phosducin domain-containing protein n=1 Tax=Arcella intermedia TaxID=1963864 RepID=A0A6B2LGW6_9EUKA
MAKADAARKMEAERLDWEEKMRNLGGPLLDSSSKTDQPKDEDSDFDLDNEEEFLMEALKQQQLKQFQMMSSAERQDKIIQEKKKINQKYFGAVTQLTQETFVPFIDAEDPSTIVIIHLYQTYFAACMKLNGILNSLARKYNTYKFGKIISTVAKPDFNDNGLACLIVYQGGDLKHSFVRVQDEVCKGFDFDDIESFLIENGAINPADAAKDWDE